MDRQKVAMTLHAPYVVEAIVHLLRKINREPFHFADWVRLREIYLELQ